jgi:hypothetical protein
MCPCLNGSMSIFEQVGLISCSSALRGVCTHCPPPFPAARSCTYDPFLDLSVPIFRDTPNAAGAGSAGAGPGSPNPTVGVRGFLTSIRHALPLTPTAVGRAEQKRQLPVPDEVSASASTLEKCLENFATEEILDRDNMYFCESCKTRRRSTKKLSVFKFPRVLVVQIKRFRYNSSNRYEKLSTDVSFPLKGLNLGPYVSADAPASVAEIEEAAAKIQTKIQQESQPQDPSGSESGEYGALFGTDPVYDLIGVSNHHGNLHGGHYVAHCNLAGAPDAATASASTPTGSEKSDGSASPSSRWLLFNDAHVTEVNPSSAAGPTAYVLFYKLRE